MTTYRLGSSAMVHTPGIVAWGINGYHFEDDRESILNVFTSGWPTVPKEAFEFLLSGDGDHYTLSADGATVIFEYDSTSQNKETPS